MELNQFGLTKNTEILNFFEKIISQAHFFFYLTTPKMKTQFSLELLNGLYWSLILHIETQNYKNNWSSRQENESENQKVRSNFEVSWKWGMFRAFLAV